MDVEQTWQELQQLPSLIVKINQREKEALHLLYRLSKRVLGEAVTASCSNCHIKAFHKLTSITYQNLIDMSEQKFKLKKGVLIDPENNGQHYSNANLTDEIAAKILAKNPKLEKYFESVGTIGKAHDENDLSKLNKAELQAKYQEKFGEEADDKLTKAELTKAIEAE
ncbi:MAG: hypothetical protein K0S09_14 [Sphingobacteriaceae bacterium]|jgi:hypothetical protein|nr:hypothetical protein [Sphingobacteriaceae bacterium]